MNDTDSLPLAGGSIPPPLFPPHACSHSTHTQSSSIRELTSRPQAQQQKNSNNTDCFPQTQIMGYFCVMLGSWSTCWFRKGRWRSPVIAWKMEQFTLHTMYEFGAHTQMNHLGSYKGWCEQWTQVHGSKWTGMDSTWKLDSSPFPHWTGLKPTKWTQSPNCKGSEEKLDSVSLEQVDESWQRPSCPLVWCQCTAS